MMAEMNIRVKTRNSIIEREQTSLQELSDLSAIDAYHLSHPEKTRRA